MCLPKHSVIQIDAVNFYINDTNRLLHVISPKFSEDLQKPRRRKPSTTISYNINYSLLKDGVHPDNILAKLWLIRITNLIHEDFRRLGFCKSSENFGDITCKSLLVSLM
jgi:hypothetical protein